MLKNITLQNFKVFREKTTFPLANFNLLTGTNGKGKSSLLQSILLMKQSIDFNQLAPKIYLNGSCVNLGDFQDVKNIDAPTNEYITMAFEFKNGKAEYNLKSELESTTLDIQNLKFKNENADFFLDAEHKTFEGKTPAFESEEKLGIKDVFLAFLLPVNLITQKDEAVNNNQNIIYNNLWNVGNNIGANSFLYVHYISADRIGSQKYYVKKDLDLFPVVGAKGENTASVLSKFKAQNVDEKLYLGQDANTLLQQTEEWLKEIFGNVKFNIDDTSQKDIIYFLFNTNSDRTPQYRPTNVGFGFSYLLPIIVSGLIAKKGEILIIENPEAHLHPKAQNSLTKFLAKVASCGVQVFVETHSEHILNGLRIAIIDNILENTQANVFYFHDPKTEDENSQEKYFTQIPISPKGKITNWIEGFFDQTENDLDIILGVK